MRLHTTVNVITTCAYSNPSSKSGQYIRAAFPRTTTTRGGVELEHVQAYKPLESEIENHKDCAKRLIETHFLDSLFPELYSAPQLSNVYVHCSMPDPHKVDS